jgi:hypothetical protein
MLKDIELSAMQQLIPVAIVFALTSAGTTLAFLANFLKHRAAESKQRLLLTGLSALAQSADNAVTRIESNIRPTLATISADGKITPETAAQLKQIAIDAVKAEAENLYPEVLKLAGIDAAGRISALVDTSAAKLAGNTRAAIGQEKMLQTMRAVQPPPTKGAA